MSELKKIWVVGSGEYSEFGIEAAFSSEQLANELAEKIRETGESASVECFALDTAIGITVREEHVAGFGSRHGEPPSANTRTEKHLYPRLHNPRGEPEMCDKYSHIILYNSRYDRPWGKSRPCDHIEVSSYISAEHAQEILQAEMPKIGTVVTDECHGAKLVYVTRAGIAEEH